MLVILLVAAGCDMFAPRQPDDPTGDVGTFLQPDTPDRVVQNVQSAIAELNENNYRRSFSEELTFRPAAAAAAASPVFAGWTYADELRYFNTLIGAANPTDQHSLRIEEPTFAPSPGQHVVDATYILTVFHNRSGIPTQFQGRLSWTMRQEVDGLWRITEWADQELDASIPTWSVLKAEFSR